MSTIKSDKPCPVCGKPIGRNKLTCSWACNSALRSNRKNCVICGREYLCSPANDVKTCSPECSTELRRRIAGRNADINAQALEQAHAAYATSHICQPDGNHFNAREWTLQAPDGQKYTFRNLKNFIRENAELFDGTVDTAYRGIVNIKRGMQGKRKRPAYQWKGWKLIEWGE